MKLRSVWSAFLISIVVAGCEQPILVRQSTFGSPDGTLVAITYGVEGANIDYIVFERGYKYMTNRVLGELRFRSDGTSIGPLFVQTGDQNFLRLEGSRKAFELSDEAMKSSGIAIKRAEFERFLKTSRTNLADLSIEGLREWINANRR